MIVPTRRNFHSNIRWMSFYNDSGEDIPPYAAMQVTGVNTMSQARGVSHTWGQQVVIVVKKSSKLTAQYDFVINSDSPVPVQDFGTCSFPRDGPVLALVNNDGGEVDKAGASFGPAPGTWGLIQNSLGFQRMQLRSQDQPFPEFRYTEVIGEQTIEFMPLWVAASPCTSFWGSRLSMVDASGNPDLWESGETRKVVPFVYDLGDNRVELFKLNQWGIPVYNLSGENFTGPIGTFMWDYTLQDGPGENGDGFWYTVAKSCVFPPFNFCPGYEE